MARLPAPRRSLPQFGFAFCLLLALCLLAVGEQQSTTPAPVPNPNASAQGTGRCRATCCVPRSVILTPWISTKQRSPSNRPLCYGTKKVWPICCCRTIDEATKCFNRAIKLDKHDAAGYNNRGYMEYRAQKYDKAMHYYRKALSLRPTDAVFHYNMGSAYFAMHDYPRAAQEYHAAYKLDPDIFNRVSKTGIMAQTTSPEDRAAFSFMIAKMYAQAGDFDRSLEYLRKAMEEGYKHINKVYTDSEFASLREDKRFAELMAQKPQPIQ